MDRAISRRVLRFALDYPFRQLGAHRLYMHAADNNERSQKLAKRLGFTQEGTLREASPTGKDVHVYSMLKPEYENKWAAPA